MDSFFVWIEYLAKMKLSALSIFFVALCLGLTVAQVQLRVYRGTLVHSRVLEQIEVLQDHLLGFDENNLGEVSNYCMLQCIYSRRAAKCSFFVCIFFFFFRSFRVSLLLPVILYV